MVQLINITPNSVIYTLNAWEFQERILKEDFVPENAVLLGKKVYVLGYYNSHGSSEKEILYLPSYEKPEVLSYSKSDLYKVLQGPYFMVAIPSKQSAVISRS